MPIAAVTPPGTTTAPRPLLVFLHGFGGNQDSSLVGAMFAALAALGPRAPDVVFPYGGDRLLLARPRRRRLGLLRDAAR